MWCDWVGVVSGDCICVVYVVGVDEVLCGCVYVRVELVCCDCLVS